MSKNRDIDIMGTVQRPIAREGLMLGRRALKIKKRG